MYIIGIKCSGHDTGAALITDRAGTLEIAAISEARLNRRKHSYAYPLLSIQYVMDHFGLKSLDEIDLICIDKHGELWPEPNSQFGRLKAKNNTLNKAYDFDAKISYLIEQTINFPREKVVYINHIDAHAASAYYLSGYKDAAILTIEGGTGFYRGINNAIEVVDRTGYGGDEYENGQIVECPSLAWPRHYQNISNLYDLITRKLGLDKFAAGKTMALAAFRDKFPKINYLNIPETRHNGFKTDYSDLIGRLAGEVRNFSPVDKKNKDEELLNEYWINIAREVQDALEADVLYMARLAAEKSGSKNLCLAGGVALSCVTNRKILDLGLFDNVFVQPAASDEGIPLGCALWGYFQIKKGMATAVMDTAYFGTPYSSAGVTPLLDAWGLSYHPTSAKEVAGVIAKGGIIGSISGGSEYGPRALGNRSILADPRVANMLEIVNAQIKHREGYRPFAASCQADKQDRYFDLPCPSPFMLMACQVKPDAKAIIPAVIHVDGTSRVQSVTPDQNPNYYELLKEFGDITGVYSLLNTSFNDDGEPIVEDHEDAVLSFVRTGLHYLHIENYLVERPSQEVCDKIKKELSIKIKNRVLAKHQEAVRIFCNMERYAKLESELSRISSADLSHSFLTYLRRIRAFRVNVSGKSGFGYFVRAGLNKLGGISRYGSSNISVATATFALVPISFVFEMVSRFRMPRAR